jgi:hypothetical protein
LEERFAPPLRRSTQPTENVEMKRQLPSLLLALLCGASLAHAAPPATPWHKASPVWGRPARVPPKPTAAQIATAPKPIWQAPTYKMYAQSLSDQILAAHPELIGANIHTRIPDTDTYTYIAGSYSFRVGSQEDPEDIQIQKYGVTFIDPRRGKTDFDGPKYEVELPLRNQKGEDIGQFTVIFNTTAYRGRDIELDAYREAVELRNELAQRIKDVNQLLAPA